MVFHGSRGSPGQPLGAVCLAFWSCWGDTDRLFALKSLRPKIGVGLVVQFSSFFAALGVKAWRAKEKRSQSVILMTPTLFWHGFSWFQGLPWAPFGSSFGGFLVLSGWHRSTFCSKVAPAKDRCGSGCVVFFFFWPLCCPKTIDYS